MVRPAPYQAVFSEAAADFILAQPKRGQRQIIKLARFLAANPTAPGNYAGHDESGRVISSLLLDDYVFAYWTDDAIAELRILDIEDAT